MNTEAIVAELERLRAKVAEQDAINAELMRGIGIVQQTQVVLGQHVELLARRLMELAATQGVDPTRH